MRPHLSKGSIGSLLASVLLLTTVVAGVVNAQYLRDALLYYQYEPSATVASFVPESGMSDQGKFLLYASQPSLNDAESFNQYCGKAEKTAAILGCYDGQKIFIYNITDPRLDGIRPTTAAHEMLHAAYKRLSSSDRQRVNTLLEAEYTKLKNDQELTGRMAFYERTQPGERDNELHSIIGTEIADISTELEAYYGRYFSDRTKVVAQYHQYHSVFEELRARADTLNGQIDSLQGKITSLRATYATESEALQAEITTFNRRAEQGDFASQAAFSQERQGLLAKSAHLENLRRDINTAISEYNALVAELNTIATETDALNRSIDSSVAPAPSL